MKIAEQARRHAVLRAVRRGAVLLWAVLLCAAVLCAALLSGCAAGGTGGGAGTQYKIYMVTKSLNTEFWQAAIAGANAAAAEYNVALTVLGPETEEDFEAQNAYIAEAVEEGADALVFSAISYEENAAAIDAAAARGVRVVVIDSDVASDSVSVRIGTDNVEAGRMTAAAALEAEWETLVVGIVNYDLASRNGQEREAGLRKVLGESGRVRDIYTINVLTTPQAAQEGSEALLREHPEINVLIGLNEPLAVGAAQAVDAMGLAGRVQMVGFDTNVRCIDLMRDGAVSALIVQNTYAMGYLGVEYAWKVLEGSSYDPNRLVDTATTIVTREEMFTTENQKALFPFG